MRETKGTDSFFFFCRGLVLHEAFVRRRCLYKLIPQELKHGSVVLWVGCGITRTPSYTFAIYSLNVTLIHREGIDASADTKLIPRVSHDRIDIHIFKIHLGVGVLESNRGTSSA